MQAGNSPLGTKRSQGQSANGPKSLALNDQALGRQEDRERSAENPHRLHTIADREEADLRLDPAARPPATMEEEEAEVGDEVGATTGGAGVGATVAAIDVSHRWKKDDETANPHIIQPTNLSRSSSPSSPERTMISSQSSGKRSLHGWPHTERAPNHRKPSQL